MNIKTLLLTVITLAAAALVAAVLPGAAARAQPTTNEPFAFSIAQLGTLKAVSGVVITPKNVEMHGGWYDSKVSCASNRRLYVKAEISISAPGAGRSRTITRKGYFRAPNCAEGGPSVGFTISANKAKSACPDGSWKPATYSFLTTTTEPTKKLKALGSLIWQKGGSC